MNNGFYVIGNTGGSSPKTIISFSGDENELISLGNTYNLDINTSSTSKQMCVRKGSNTTIIVKNCYSTQREFMYYYLG